VKRNIVEGVPFVALRWRPVPAAGEYRRQKCSCIKALSMLGDFIALD